MTDRMARPSPKNSHRRSWWYRRALWRAIQAACENGPDSPYCNDVHPLNGLRIIRIFEENSGIEFNPFDSTHCDVVSGRRAFIALNHQGMLMRKWRREDGREAKA